MESCMQCNRQSYFLKPAKAHLWELGLVLPTLGKYSHSSTSLPLCPALSMGWISVNRSRRNQDHMHQKSSSHLSTAAALLPSFGWRGHCREGATVLDPNACILACVPCHSTSSSKFCTEQGYQVSVTVLRHTCAAPVRPLNHEGPGAGQRIMEPQGRKRGKPPRNSLSIFREQSARCR